MSAAPDATFDTHLVFDLISAGVTVGWLIVGLLIKAKLGDISLAQSNDKADLLKNQNEVKEQLISQQAKVKEELVLENSTTRQAIAVHTAEDEGRFRVHEQRLDGTDKKLDSIGIKIDRFESLLNPRSSGA